MKLKISVIICTFNPEEKYFSPCLAAVSKANSRSQVLEVIIIDNNSSNNLKCQTYIKTFLEQNANAILITEKKQGLTPARLRGIKEARGELLVFVDDDNFVSSDFFEKGHDIARKNPHIGSWSGQVHLVFEEEPEAWTKQYWGLLVSKKLDRDIWSNLPHLPETMPCGAGLFVRKQIADYYKELNETGKRNIQLDRNGKSLFSGGDNDLAACACDNGLGVGIFHTLIVQHYIPKFRTKKEYLLKLAEGIAASTVVFHSFRGEFAKKRNLKRKIADMFRLLLKNKTARQFYRAVLSGETQGINIVNQQISKNNSK